ncbi:unnamed protein product [Sphagnum tenellum]
MITVHWQFLGFTDIHAILRYCTFLTVVGLQVTITPEVPKKVSRDVMNKLQTTAAEFKRRRGAYDGDKILFTSGPLNVNNEAQVYPVFLDDERRPSFKLQDSPPQQGSQPATSPPPRWYSAEGKTDCAVDQGFVVHIKFAAKVNMRVFGDAVSEQPGAQLYRAEDALRVLNVVLLESASSKGYLLVRDNFFHPSLGKLGNLGEGLEAWHGFRASIRATQMGLTLQPWYICTEDELVVVWECFLCSYTTTTTVIKPIMVEEFIREKLDMQSNDSLDSLDERDWNKVKIMLKKVRVETTHLRVPLTHDFRLQPPCVPRSHLGGYNSPLSPDIADFLGTTTILFGMYISHGSPSDVDAASIAATQPSEMKMNRGLYEEGDWQHGGMVTGGVSASQFQQCLDLEVTAFIKAGEALESGYHPKITFIVAQKGPKTQFFPIIQSIRSGHVLPGTVIDKDVWHPSNYDFFLCSHAGLTVHLLTIQHLGG